MQNLNPMRQVCNVIPAGPAGYTKIFSQGGTASGWVGEKDARPETAASTLAALTPYWGEICGNPEARDLARRYVLRHGEVDHRGSGRRFISREESSFVSGSARQAEAGFLA